MVSCSIHGSGSRNSRKRIGWYGKRLVLFISQIKVITRRSIFPLIYGYIKLDRLGVRVGVDVFHLQLCRVVVVVPGCPCVLLHDPDNGLSDGAYRVISAPENMEDDSIILISSGTSEAEVLPSELSPISTGRSHKEDFLRWKAEREAEGMEFYNRLSEVMDTEDDLAVGDIVAFTNDYGVVFGPQEVLAFRKPWNGDRCVYLDSDAYWFPDRPDQLTLLSKKGAE